MRVENNACAGLGGRSPLTAIFHRDRRRRYFLPAWNTAWVL